MDQSEITALFARLGTARIAPEDYDRFRRAQASVAVALARFPNDLGWSDEPAHRFGVVSEK